jgi:hypothetical protein
MQKLFNILLIIIFCSSSVNAAWYNPAWNYRTKITIQASSVNGTVTELPVFVDLSHLPGSFFDNVSANGADLRVTVSDGSTEIAREVVSLSKTANTGELWFKAPSLSSAANTEFYIYYGNNTATAPLANSIFGSQNVWSNGFVAVYHMNALTNGTASVLDSTSFANHGTPRGGMSTLASGKSGNAIDFDGTNDYVLVNTAVSTAIANSNFSLSAWFQRDGSTSDYFMGNLGTNNFQNLHWGFRNGTTFTLGFFNNDYDLNLGAPTSSWKFYSTTYNVNSNLRQIYVDGALGGSSTGSQDLASSTTFVLGTGFLAAGGQNVDGRLDELRIVNKERNRNWIATEYNNQNSPLSFYTLSAEQGSIAEFPHRLTVTIKASQVNGSVTQMPVFINLDHMPGHFFTNVKGSGADIRMTTSDGVSQVPVEIVSLDKATTNGELWFRAPSLTSASDTVFYLYYGLNGATMPAASSSFGSQNVWSNGFVAVYHMNALTNGTASVLDSTSFANHGTPFGGMLVGNIVAGKTGSAIDFDGVNDAILLSTIVLSNVGSYSAWVNTDVIPSNVSFLEQNHFLGLSDRPALYLRNSGAKYDYSNYDGSSYRGVFNFGNGVISRWDMVAGSYNGSLFTAYHNSLSAQGNSGNYTLTNAGANRYIGSATSANRNWDGKIDEVRIANKARNRNWIATEYNNQNSASSFYTIDLNENLNNWSTRNKITIPSTVVNGSVSELPIYVNLRHLPANFWTSVKNSGSDIRMTNAAGTPLAIELVSIDKVNKTGELWFKAPTLTSASHNHFYIYSGNNGGSFASPVSQYGSQAVWSNGFVAVYHLNALTNGTASVLDSTSFARHGTPFGGMAAGANLVAGRTGTAIDFDGSNDTIQINSNYDLANQNLTISAWAYLDTTSKRGAFVKIGDGSTGIGLGVGSNTLDSSGNKLVGLFEFSRFIPTGQDIGIGWHYAVISLNSFTPSLFKDSLELGPFAGANANSPSANTFIGGYQASQARFFDGAIDEVKVANKARNRNWITTEYNNQSYPERFYMINNLSLMNATFFGRMF